ncbi:hypothetical protein A4A49_55170 [Nicotiana attenuata]|uniref:Uncharacterized protein n=1 Tax=Nicotiana attenuata TaxID=49451 RepID=A0A1J6KPA5_NICAT|nr:hypothetical protein A4A49_55170 [Nicotiana attenuata]
MEKWAELPPELITMIAKPVEVMEDFIVFGGVCTSWRTAASKDNFDGLSPQLPLLMMPDKDDVYRKFYSFQGESLTDIISTRS